MSTVTAIKKRPNSIFRFRHFPAMVVLQNFSEAGLIYHDETTDVVLWYQTLTAQSIAQLTYHNHEQAEEDFTSLQQAYEAWDSYTPDYLKAINNG